MKRGGGTGGTLWQSLLLSMFGIAASALITVVTAGLLESASDPLPLWIQLLLVCEGGKLFALLQALSGATAVVFAATAVAEVSIAWLVRAPLSYVEHDHAAD